MGSQTTMLVVLVVYTCSLVRLTEATRDPSLHFEVLHRLLRQPPSIPPPCQSKVQIDLNQALLGCCFGMVVVWKGVLRIPALNRN